MLFKKKFNKIENYDYLDLPLKKEIIKDELYVNIFVHSFRYSAKYKEVSSLAFLTEGLYKKGQKEFFLVLINHERNCIDDIAELLGFIKAVFHLAIDGKIVDSGQTSEFKSPGLFGNIGILYTTPPPHLDPYFKYPTLSIILLSKEELESLPIFGSMRILSMLGKLSTYFPFPYWSDIKRKKLPVKKVMNESILRDIGLQLKLSNSWLFLKDRVLYLQIREKDEIEFPQGGLNPNFPITILPSFHPSADKCLTYTLMKRGKVITTAIHNPHENTNIMGGCMLIILPKQNSFEAKIIEDGFSISISEIQWEQLWDSFKRKKEFKLQEANNGGISSVNSFIMEWK